MRLFRHQRLADPGLADPRLKPFWATAALLWVAGLAACIIIPVGEELFWINAHRSVGADWFFSIATRLGEEWAYVGLVVVLLLYRYRTVWALPLLGIAVTMLAHGSKAWFGHDRPYPYFTKLGLWHELKPVEGIELLRGANSFPSGHTMSAFALYTFAVLNLPRKPWVSCSLLAVAAATGLSRMYLLQHFLKDVVAGAALGIALGALTHLLVITVLKEKTAQA